MLSATRKTSPPAGMALDLVGYFYALIVTSGGIIGYLKAGTARCYVSVCHVGYFKVYLVFGNFMADISC